MMTLVEAVRIKRDYPSSKEAGMLGMRNRPPPLQVPTLSSVYFEVSVNTV